MTAAEVELRAFAPGAFAYEAVCLECLARNEPPRPLAVTVRLPIRHAPRGGRYAYSYVDLCRKHALVLLRGVKEILEHAQMG